MELIDVRNQINATREALEQLTVREHQLVQDRLKSSVNYFYRAANMNGVYLHVNSYDEYSGCVEVSIVDDSRIYVANATIDDVSVGLKLEDTCDFPNKVIMVTVCEPEDFFTALVLVTPKEVNNGTDDQC